MFVVVCGCSAAESFCHKVSVDEEAQKHFHCAFISRVDYLWLQWQTCVLQCLQCITVRDMCVGASAVCCSEGHACWCVCSVLQGARCVLQWETCVLCVAVRGMCVGVSAVCCRVRDVCCSERHVCCSVSNVLVCLQCVAVRDMYVAVPAVCCSERDVCCSEGAQRYHDGTFSRVDCLCLLLLQRECCWGSTGNQYGFFH